MGFWKSLNIGAIAVVGVIVLSFSLLSLLHLTGSFSEIVFMVAGIGCIILFYLAWLRLLFMCLIRTPIEINKTISEGKIQALFSAPLTDREIFYGLGLPPLVRGLEELGDLIGLFIGAGIPLLALALIMNRVSPPGVSPMSGPFNFAWMEILTVVQYALFAIIMALASGTNAYRMPVAPAVAGSLVFAFLLSLGITWLPRIYSISHIRQGSMSYDYVGMLAALQAIGTLILVLILFAMVAYGVKQVSILRRSG
jgi:hypothetical protein